MLLVGEQQKLNARHATNAPFRLAEKKRADRVSRGGSDDVMTYGCPDKVDAWCDDYVKVTRARQDGCLV